MSINELVVFPTFDCSITGDRKSKMLNYFMMLLSQIKSRQHRRG